MKHAKKTIAECAKIIPGVQEQKSLDDDIQMYNALLPAQLSAEGIIGEYGKIRRVLSDEVALLQKGDVVIKRLNPDCAVVFEDNIQVVPSGNLFVIRPNKEILDSYYLAFILSYSQILAQISQRSGISTKVSAVTGSQLGGCEIPLPELSVQKKLGMFWRKANLRNLLLNKLIFENKHLLQVITAKLYS